MAASDMGGLRCKGKRHSSQRARGRGRHAHPLYPPASKSLPVGKLNREYFGAQPMSGPHHGTPMPKHIPHRRPRLPDRSWLAGAVALALAGPAFAQSTPTVEELARRLQALEARYGAATSVDGQETLDLQALDQRLRALERNLELQEEARAAKEKAAPVVAVNDRGASFRSGDGAYEVKIRGLLQGDGRFFNSGAPGANDSFLLRTARPTIEGTLGKWVGFRFTPEFAGDSASIVDAYADLQFSPAATLRVGKFTSPVGLERLQSSASLPEIERALASELLPNRDLGVQLQGELAGGKVSYAIGVFNGAVDGRDATTPNPDDEFEYAGRLFFEPLKGSDSFWA